MFLATEAISTITALDFLFAAFQAAALLFVLFWIKLVLDRRRLAEDNEEVRRLQDQRWPQHSLQSLYRPRVGIVRNSRSLRCGPAGRDSRGRECEVRERLDKITEERTARDWHSGTHSAFADPMPPLSSTDVS